MRILIVGGYGLIGGYVLARLGAEGHDLIGVGRDVRSAQRRFPAARWISINLARVDASAWTEALNGVDAIVNCAGALQDSSRDDLQKVHLDGLKVLAEAARRAGVKRLVHVSAAGVAASPGAFGATKRAAEAFLETLDIDWMVLRPGLVLAPSAYGGSALLRALAAFPVCIPAIHAGQIVQVVSAQDVAAAVAKAVDPAVPGRIAVDLVAAQQTTLADILIALRAWLGRPPAPLVRMPTVLAGLTAGLADAAAHLGWRSPLRTTAVAQLGAGVRGDAGAAERLLGVRMRGLADILADAPSGVQERWFAALYLLKPLGIATLAFFWIVSGLVGLWRHDPAAAVLTAAGFAPSVAQGAVLTGSIVDLALGLLVCHRASGRLALLGTLVVSISYLVGASLWRPDLWADPLGPLVKVLPGMALATLLLALWPER